MPIPSKGIREHLRLGVFTRRARFLQTARKAKVPRFSIMRLVGSFPPRGENSSAAIIPLGAMRISAEWKDEIRRRVQEMKDGTAIMVPHDEAMANVWASLVKRREERVNKIS